MDKPLSRRALGRATLARQLLLRPVDLPVVDAVDHVVGLQAQEEGARLLNFARPGATHEFRWHA